MSYWKRRLQSATTESIDFRWRIAYESARSWHRNPSFSQDERSLQQLFSIQTMLFSLHRGFTVYAIKFGNTEAEQNPPEDR